MRFNGRDGTRPILIGSIHGDFFWRITDAAVDTLLHGPLDSGPISSSLT